MALSIALKLSMRVCGRINNNIYVLIKTKEYFDKMPKMPNPCVPSKSINLYANTAVNTVSVSSFLKVLLPDSVIALVTWNGKDKLVNVDYNEDNIIDHFQLSSASDWIMKAFKVSLSYRFQIAAVYQENDELFHLFEHPEATSRRGIEVYSILAFEEVAWDQLKKRAISIIPVDSEDKGKQQPLQEEAEEQHQQEVEQGDDGDVCMTTKGSVTLKSRAIKNVSDQCAGIFKTPTVTREGIRSYDSHCSSRYTALGKALSAHRNCIKIPKKKPKHEPILHGKAHGGATSFCLYAGGMRHIAVAAAAGKTFASVSSIHYMFRMQILCHSLILCI